jgi:hypothetical protein
MLTAFLIAAGCGLLIGLYIRRESLREEKISGGLPAQMAHYLACTMLSSTTPAIVTSIIIGLPFVQMFGTALSFVLLGALFILAYAYVETQQTASTTVS